MKAPISNSISLQVDHARGWFPGFKSIKTFVALKPSCVLQIAARLNAKASNATAYFLAELHTVLAALDSTVGQTVSPFPNPCELLCHMPMITTFKTLYIMGM